ncbi:RagB/SusD family nutrient uptake outer membrane protein [Zunongwangia sp. HRR-M8]|uniref:RagB/SusD family nutrient uptake outer membrane protein n=1 Tax=Zunongwangia sp. HRR-M8 TaxID=3015170 RepID=UPI0022DE8306|nr:RagB/SusD family nutrient uptake outer membrane protein [Zunongwangia sp. HRR-M8]WBL23060.1 RagB/SusD family nutrient uptake outer membrane protein [Zunongwangia sp. HRR-M8]
MKNLRLQYKTMTKTLVVVSALLAMSCSDDYLDVKPEGQATTGSGYFQGENVEQAVVASYSHLLDYSQHSFSFSGIFSIASDDADKGSSPGDTGADKAKLDNFTHEPTDVSVAGIWGANYRGVATANTGIDIVNEPSNNLAEATIAEYQAEFKFFRAYHYFTLVKVFGGVPIITEETDPSDQEALLVRDSSEDVYNFIVEDLTEASENLPQTPAQTGRVTRGTAKTLLAKVQMYQGNWEEVLELTNEVIASGQYALHPNYEELWRIQNENTVESIFEVQGSSSENLGVNNLAEHHGVRGQWGWGFDVPSQSLVDAYNAAGDDIRRDATIIFRGEEMYDNDLYDSDPNISAVVSEDAPNPYYSEKMYFGPLAANALDKNLILLRYADVLLMNAEANNELGNSSAALASLNEVRSRVELPAITTTSQSELRQTIWKERRLEFGMEFDRYFDVIRQGRGQEVFGPLGFQAGKNEVFPIPQDQISLSGGLLKQNPGY